MSRAQARMLPDGRRLHLQDGPIDLVIEAFGRDDAVAEAYRASIAAFEGLLDALCAELPLLRAEVVASGRGSVFLPLPGEGGSGEARDGWGSTAKNSVSGPSRPELERAEAAPTPHPAPRCGDTFPRQGKEDVLFPASAGSGVPRGPVARRMAAAVAPFAAETFITPMAAVAGAVAEHVLAVMTAAAPLDRAYINNGGDIALHLAPGERLTVGLIDRPDRPGLLGHVEISDRDGIGGVATSGWRGRSFSLGIADTVTVLARSAAEADAAATIIANAVDLPGHPAVIRVPADSLQPDSDLGARLVTRDVGSLTEEDVTQALASGLACADELLSRGLIRGAALQLQRRLRIARFDVGQGPVLLPLVGEGGSGEARGGWGSPAKDAALRTPPVALRAPPSPDRGGRFALGAAKQHVLEPAHA